MGKSRYGEVVQDLCDLHISFSLFRVQHRMNQRGIYVWMELQSNGIALNLEVMLHGSNLPRSYKSGSQTAAGGNFNGFES